MFNVTLPEPAGQWERFHQFLVMGTDVVNSFQLIRVSLDGEVRSSDNT
jgi:hypothetical protein